MKIPALLALLMIMANLTACRSSPPPKNIQADAATSPVATTPKPATPPPSEPVLDHWIADASTGCKVYNPHPIPNESIRWKGKCKDGLAEGKGTLEWFKNGQPNCVYTGPLREGKMEGHATFRWVDGSSFDGEFLDDNRNGHGTLRRADGSSSSGIWRDGNCSDCTFKPAPTPAETVSQLCEQLSTGASIDGLRCENAAKNVAEDTTVGAIQAHCQSYESPGKKLACFETGKKLLPPRDGLQIAKYEDSCQGKKGKVKADCYSEVYAQVGIKQSSEQAQQAQARQAEDQAAQQQQKRESLAEQREAMAENCRERCSDTYSNCVSSAVTSTLGNQIMALAAGAGDATRAMAMSGHMQHLTCKSDLERCKSNCR